MKRALRLTGLLLISLLLITSVSACKTTEPTDTAAPVITEEVKQESQAAPAAAEQEKTPEVKEEVSQATEPAPEPEAEEESQPVEKAEEPKQESPSVAVKEKSMVYDDDFWLYILHTNDTHGRILEGKYDGMGFAKISTIANMYRDRVDNLLILDAGDAMHGTTLATLVEGESVAQVMNTVGYDAMAAGNHDFNYGYDRLIELNGMTDFPILSANTYDASGNRILPAYEIFTFGGVDVAVFGLTTSESYYKVHPKNIEGLTFEDSVQTAQLMVDELSSKADIIIALVHLGMDEASTDTSVRLAEQVSGIDLIIDGHSHTTLPEGLLVGDTLIVQTGNYDQNLGAVDMHIVYGKVADIKAQLYTKEMVAAEGIEDDPEVLAVVDTWLAEQEKITSEVVAYTETVLDGERADVRTRPTNLSRLITTAMIEATGADCALTNGGGIRASIDIGEITMGEIISVLPFNNTCVVIEVTGQELYDAVEHGLAAAPEPNGGYCQLGNIVPFYNIYNEPGSRVYKLKVGGETVDKNATYKLATNDFTAAGGDGYTMFADKPLLAEVGTLDGVFAQYMREYFPVP